MSLVLADDHDMFLEALMTALTGLGEEIDAVSQDADRVVDLVVTYRPEVCVLDVKFTATSELEGLNAAALIRDRAPEVKVLLLTGAAGDEVWSAYDDRVVDGVVNKLCDIDVVQTSIGRVARGERVVEGWPGCPPERPAEGWERRWGYEPLSERERQVLQLLAEGAGTHRIAHTLGVSANTVRTHVQNVLHKLGVHDRSKAVRVALSRGLLDREPTDRLLDRATDRELSDWELDRELSDGTDRPSDGGPRGERR